MRIANTTAAGSNQRRRPARRRRSGCRTTGRSAESVVLRMLTVSASRLERHLHGELTRARRVCRAVRRAERRRGLQRVVGVLSVVIEVEDLGDAGELDAADL